MTLDLPDKEDHVSHNIDAGLTALAVPIDQPQNHPQNYRQGNVEDIAASLQRFGQVRPIVVQAQTGYVVAGNHTLKAAKSLEWDQIAIVTVELDDDEAEAYLAADNRLSDKATNDDAVLAPLLERLMLAGRLEGTGYSPDDVDDMLSAMDAMPEVEAPEFEGGNATTDEELAERFANRSQVALRQFVLMYEQDLEAEIVGMKRKLEGAWGMSGMANVVLEALRRATAEPPVEGLTPEEVERAAEAAAAEDTVDASQPGAVDAEPLEERADDAFEERVLAAEATEPTDAGQRA